MSLEFRGQLPNTLVHVNRVDSTPHSIHQRNNIKETLLVQFYHENNCLCKEYNLLLGYFHYLPVRREANADKTRRIHAYSNVCRSVSGASIAYLSPVALYPNFYDGARARSLEELEAGATQAAAGTI